MPKDYEQTISAAIKWLAAEYKFFKELKSDLTDLKRDLTIAQEKSAVSDIKHALGDFRYIAKAERRFNRYEQEVEEMLEGLKSKISSAESAEEINRLHLRLHAEAAALLRSLSLYEGRIRDYLLHLRERIQEHQLDQAQAALMETNLALEDLEQWLQALAIDLSAARRIHVRFCITYSGNKISELRADALAKKHHLYVRWMGWLFQLLRYFHKNKEKYSFSREKYLIYRIKSKKKTPVLEVYFPQDFSVFSENYVKEIVGKIVLVIKTLGTLNHEARSLLSDAYQKARLEQEQQELEKYYLLFRAVYTREVSSLYGGNIEQYNQQFRKSISFLHRVGETEFILGMGGGEASIRSIGYLLSEFRGFGDILFTVKLYLFYQELLPQCEHYLLYLEHQEQVLVKVRETFPTLKLKKAGEVKVDVAYAFMWKGQENEEELKAKLKAKLIIGLREYAPVLWRGKLPNLNFHFGFQEGCFGISPSSPVYTKEVTIRLLQELTLPMAIPYQDAHWGLIYFSNLRHMAIYENILRVVALEKKRPIVVLVVTPDPQTYVKEIIGDNFKKTLHDGKGVSILEITDIDGLKLHQTLYFIVAKTLPHQLFSAVLRHCDLPSIVTGDQSLSEAIAGQNLFFYRSPSWKRMMFDDLLALFSRLGYPDIAQVLERFHQAGGEFTDDTGEVSRELIVEGCRRKDRAKDIYDLFVNSTLQQRFKEALVKIGFIDKSYLYLGLFTLEYWTAHQLGRIEEIRQQERGLDAVAADKIAVRTVVEISNPEQQLQQLNSILRLISSLSVMESPDLETLKAVVETASSYLSSLVAKRLPA